MASDSFSLTLHSERLHIRELRITDSAFIIRLLNEASFIQNIGDKGVRSLDDAANYINEAGFQNYANYGFGMFLVELTGVSTPIGICGLLKRDFLPHPDFGFAFVETEHGKGYGTEAAKTIVAWAQRRLSVKRLSAFTSTSNTASIHVLTKNGFRSLGEQVLAGRTEPTHVLEWSTDAFVAG